EPGGEIEPVLNIRIHELTHEAASRRLGRHPYGIERRGRHLRAWRDQWVRLRYRLMLRSMSGSSWGIRAGSRIRQHSDDGDGKINIRRTGQDRTRSSYLVRAD